MSARYGCARATHSGSQRSSAIQATGSRRRARRRSRRLRNACDGRGDALFRADRQRRRRAPRRALRRRLRGERPAYSDERSALALPLEGIDGRVEAVFAPVARRSPSLHRPASLGSADFADQALIAIRHMLLLDRDPRRADRKLAGVRRGASGRRPQRTLLRAISEGAVRRKAGSGHHRPQRRAFLRRIHCHIASCSTDSSCISRPSMGCSTEAIDLVNRTFPAEPSPPPPPPPPRRARRRRAGGRGEPARRGRDRRPATALRRARRTARCLRCSDRRASSPLPLLKNEASRSACCRSKGRKQAPLPARQIELLKTFADLAAIALEGARLADECAHAHLQPHRCSRARGRDRQLL